MPDDLLQRLTAEPRQAAILFDVVGTLAPIVREPEDARVPEETRRELARLASRYALVACVSGRAWCGSNVDVRNGGSGSVCASTGYGGSLSFCAVTTFSSGPRLPSRSTADSRIVPVDSGVESSPMK